MGMNCYNAGCKQVVKEATVKEATVKEATVKEAIVKETIVKETTKKSDKDCIEKTKGQETVKLRVINIGLQNFYDALESQNVKVAQIQWRPPAKQSEEITALLDAYL